MKQTDISHTFGQKMKNGFIFLFFAAITHTACAAAPSAPAELMCELLAHPETAVIADAAPEFGWIVNSELTNDVQTAYQIRVASDSTLLDKNAPDLWDSAKTPSDDSANVSYAGQSLALDTVYYWKVRTWNKEDQPSDWSAIQSFKTASSFLPHSTARYPLTLTPVTPVDIRPVGPGHYFIDFGKDAFGYLRWTLPPEQIKAAQIKVHFGEKQKNGLIDRTPGGTIRYYQVDLPLVEGTGDYEIHPPKDPRNTSGAAVLIPEHIGAICPFRYIELVNCPIEPKPEQFQQITVHYPFDETASSFQSDNPVLNRIWDLCKYSMKAASFCGVYVDGDRERIPYEADAYINQLSHYAVDREFSLARYSHEYLMTHPTWPIEWRQHSIMMAWADYMYTGNTESLAACYEQLKNDKLLQKYARSSDGLLDTPTEGDPRIIIDWPAGERDGYDIKRVNTVVNGFYYQNLLQMRQIAEALGKPADARSFQETAANVYDAFQTAFFNASTGLYVDGEGSAHSSLHANMWPLAFELVPEDKKTAVVDFIENRRRADGGMIACSVYGVQYLLEALYRADEEDYALELLTNTTSTGWVNMMEEGSTITMEAWGGQYKPNQDWNHAWGAAAGNIITRYVMGIQPLEPGFKKALIHPHPGTLKTAQIVTPTIRGPISLSMSKRPDRCAFQLTIPANMTARFVLPENCRNLTTVALDGKPVSPQQDGILRYIDPIGSGSHVVTAE